MEPWTRDTRRAFILSQTVAIAPPLCPELPMRLITEACPLWTAREADLDRLALPAPYWGFAWPGGQALARYLLDNPSEVSGRSVMDFGAGCGIEAFAALKAGARLAIGADIDPFAADAMHLNAELLGMPGEDWYPSERGAVSAETSPLQAPFRVTTADLLDDSTAWDVVLAGDMFYDPELARRTLAWLKRLAEGGSRVLLGDPHRGQLERLDPSLSLTPVAQYLAPSDVDVEGRYRKWTTVYALT